MISIPAKYKFAKLGKNPPEIPKKKFWYVGIFGGGRSKFAAVRMTMIREKSTSPTNGCTEERFQYGAIFLSRSAVHACAVYYKFREVSESLGKDIAIVEII